MSADERVAGMERETVAKSIYESMYHGLAKSPGYAWEVLRDGPVAGGGEFKVKAMCYKAADDVIAALASRRDEAGERWSVPDGHCVVCRDDCNDAADVLFTPHGNSICRECADSVAALTARRADSGPADQLRAVLKRLYFAHRCGEEVPCEACDEADDILHARPQAKPDSGAGEPGDALRAADAFLHALRLLTTKEEVWAYVTQCDDAKYAHDLVAAALTQGAGERAGVLDADDLRDWWHSLDIITRACEAGAYTGKTSAAVTQARTRLEHWRARALTPPAGPSGDVVDHSARALQNFERPQRGDTGRD